MPCRSTHYRKRLKENDPEAYEKYLERQKLASRKSRDKQKQCVQASLTPAERAELEMRRKRKNARSLAHYYRKKAEREGQKGNSKSSSLVKISSPKRLKDMSEDERRAYNAMMRKKQRDARSSQKKTAERTKRRRQYLEWKLKKAAGIQIVKKIRRVKVRAKLVPIKINQNRKKPPPIKMLEADSIGNVTLTEISSAASGASGRQLFLQTKLKDNGNEGYELVVLDGSSVWEGAISEYALDRRCEALKMDFNTYVKETTSALTKATQSDTAFECIFKPQGQSSSDGQLVWKKVPAQSIKYNLGSLNMKKTAQPGERTASVLSECIQTIQSLQNQIRSLQADNERLAQERQNALKRLDKCVTAKDELEKDLYSKFVAVLNSKKERIRQMGENQGSLPEPDQEQPVVDVKSSPVASTSKTCVSDTKQRVSGGSSVSPPGAGITSAAYDIDTDEESPQPKKKQPRRNEARQNTSVESSLNLGDDEEEVTSKVPVRRRARRQPTAKKETPAKPILPRVPSISSVERDNQIDSRRSSLRKSGSGKSNKSSDNLDPDDLMNDF